VDTRNDASVRSRIYRMLYHRSAYSTPMHRRPVHEPETCERDGLKAAADEDAIVRFLALVVGVAPDDPAGQRLARELTSADVRHIVRAAYRHGRSSRE